MCLLVLREPYQATCCGYSFCRVCIKRIQTNNISCPCCKAEQFDHFPNKGLQRSLYDFKVYCSNKSQGCQWTGELGQLQHHLNLSATEKNQVEGCKYAQIQCLFCSKLFERSTIQSHQSDQCSQRPFSCEFARIFTHITTVSSITIGLCVATTQCYAPKNVANLFNVSVLGAMLLESAL